ncbi:MAG: hypothetical protein GVY02_10255 [Bacteroidetes bacterium]|jgi:hypothetical protein|nr:hypothetical protein [Bacteroidota bacterium]
MNKEKRIRKIDFGSDDVTGFIDSLDEVDLDASFYLLLLAGPYKAGKKTVLGRLQKKLGEFKEIDLREVIDLNEEQCFRNIDELFEYIGETEKNLLFRHGDALAGEYTGFTYSSTRYATPQEKYLLQKINGSERFAVIDLDDVENIDKTLERFAQTAILFNGPASFPGKLLWKLKQVKVNGHRFSNKRPKSA